MENSVRDLDIDCKNCGSKLYAYYHEACSGDEATGSWYVECRNGDCEFTVPFGFASYECINETEIYDGI